MDIEVKNVFVTSENRDTAQFPYGNAYTLYLTNPIKNIRKVELVYASVPNTLFNLTSNANFISFSNTVTKTKPIASSYDNICAEARMEAKKAYFEFEAQPATITP